jgi:3'-phosphoadenosine 5'-phosphosulfate sulfotransferase (PAPS reductase)/FAD synthetase
MEVVAVSGGKDSTALALRLAEVESDISKQYIITPTGDELPPMDAHWSNLATLLRQPLHALPAPTLRQLIDRQKCLPNWRMRWCTRLIKIIPCIDYLTALPGKPVMCVGLRADEEHRGGLYSEQVTSRYPLREWGWNRQDVEMYLIRRGVDVPDRTDCARCPMQRLFEWWSLWKYWPTYFEDAERDEARTGFTFRSPGRDSWPAALKELRLEFEKGRIPPKRKSNPDGPCRVCRL